MDATTAGGGAEPGFDASSLTARPVAASMDDEVSNEIGQLYASARRRQIAIAYAITGDRDMAEQAVDEAYVKVLTSFSRKRRVPVDNLRAYVDRVVIHVSIRESRRRTGLQLRMRRGSYENAKVTPDPADAVSTQEFVRTLLSRLPAAQRAVIVLRFGLDLKDQEIATWLHVPVGTVKSRLARDCASQVGEHRT